MCLYRKREGKSEVLSSKFVLLIKALSNSHQSRIFEERGLKIERNFIFVVRIVGLVS